MFNQSFLSIEVKNCVQPLVCFHRSKELCSTSRLSPKTYRTVFNQSFVSMEVKNCVQPVVCLQRRTELCSTGRLSPKTYRTLFNNRLSPKTSRTVFNQSFVSKDVMNCVQAVVCHQRRTELCSTSRLSP